MDKNADFLKVLAGFFTRAADIEDEARKLTNEILAFYVEARKKTAESSKGL